MDYDFNDDLAWVDKYRPRTIQDCILPERIKKNFLDFVKGGKFPNLLLSGGAGVGKTSIAKALLNDMDYEVILVNASSTRGIETVRTTITEFASTVSLEGKHKAIIFDEADGFTRDAQDALRGTMEEFSNIRFILTCNFKNKLNAAVQSRTSMIDFSMTEEEKSQMKLTFLKRLFEILDLEKVTYDRKAVGSVVKRFYPDNRKILNDLQRLASSGKIDELSVKNSQAANIEQLIEIVKHKDVGRARAWVANNADMDVPRLYRDIYDNFYNVIEDNSKPQMILYLGQYQAYAAVVADQEINTMALVCELIGSMEFKS